MKVSVAQSYLTLCEPMDCSPPGSSVPGILQARILEGLPVPSPGDPPDPGVEPGLLHCRRIFYRLSHQGSPGKSELYKQKHSKSNARLCARSWEWRRSISAEDIKTWKDLQRKSRPDGPGNCRQWVHLEALREVFAASMPYRPGSQPRPASIPWVAGSLEGREMGT